jgi:putative transposase
MANTNIQIHIHTVFSVQNRESLIKDEWKDELYKYITGIIQNQQHKLIAINGMPDHVHILFGMKPTQSLSDLLQDIKGNSSKWINEKKLAKGKFSWQEGYGAFSYSKSQLKQVIHYIEKQEEHHQNKSFVEEYKEFLTAFDIEYNEKYIFKPIELE